LADEIAEGEALAIGKKMIELPAIGDEIFSRIEDSGEVALHPDNLAADGDATAATLLQALRAREMVGVDMGLENPGEAQLLVGKEMCDAIDALMKGASGARLVVEHGVDDGTIRSPAAMHDMTDRAGGAVVQGFDERKHHALSL
jgi:hypothetical protein